MNHYSGVLTDDNAEGFAMHTDRAMLAIMVQTLANMKERGLDVSSADKAVQILQRAGYCASELKLFLRYVQRSLA